MKESARRDLPGWAVSDDTSIMSHTDVHSALGQILADTYALAVKTHAAHWNVTGQGFFELHAAFGTQYLALFTAADELAERLRALGVVAPSGLSALAGTTTVQEISGTAGAGGTRADHARRPGAGLGRPAGPRGTPRQG